MLMKPASLAAITLVLVACTPKPEGNPNTFDLICVERGTRIGHDGSRTGMVDTRRYSIDLDRRSWCFTSSCENTLWPIRRFDAGVIVLHDEEWGTTEIRRASGEISTNSPLRASHAGYISNGKCTKAPFTPLPPSRL